MFISSCTSWNAVKLPRDNSYGLILKHLFSNYDWVQNIRCGSRIMPHIVARAGCSCLTSVPSILLLV